VLETGIWRGSLEDTRIQYVPFVVGCPVSEYTRLGFQLFVIKNLVLESSLRLFVYQCLGNNFHNV